MKIGRYPLHRRASWAFYQLNEEEQRQVKEALATLDKFPPDPAENRVRRWPTDPNLYVVCAEGGWRIFVRADEGEEPEVVDIAHQGTLDFFAQAAAKSRNGMRSE